MFKRENTKLLRVLGAILSGLVVALMYWRAERIVSWLAIGVVVLMWVGSNVALRTHEKTWGKEREYIDWWSVPHFLAGVLLGCFGLGCVWVTAIAIAWELIEVSSDVEEHPPNRVVDVVLAVAGWSLANMLGGGSFAWL